MKIILTEEVIGLGEPGKILDVAPGYARNYLVPRKLAVYANTGSIRELEHHKRRLERKNLRMQEAAKTVAERITTEPLRIAARAGESGKLYGSVTTADIAASLQEQYGVTVDKRKIQLREPIHSTGTHEVDIRLLGDIRTTLTVNVVDSTHQSPVVPAAPPTPPASSEEAGE